MKIIGLSGGIGTGKTTVAGFLSELGAAVIDADIVGHHVLELPEVKAQLTATFGKDILFSQGTVDRKRLAAIVFANEPALAKLNHIMHPPIRRLVEKELEEYRIRGTAVAVLEAPLLEEAGWTEMVDQLWVTTVTKEVALKRLIEKVGLTESEALARINSQPQQQSYTARADVTVETDVSLDELREKVAVLWRNSIVPAEGEVAVLWRNSVTPAGDEVAVLWRNSALV